jgi:predicted transcriptional regulator
LNRKFALTILLAALTLTLVFAATANGNDRPINFSDFQHIGSLRQLSASAPIVLGTSLHSNATQPLDQPTRLEIYSYIKENPGVHFRGISQTLGLSVGVVQYHLGVLEHAALITAHFDGQNKRFFERGTYTKTDITLISLTRHETTAKILTILAQSSAYHKDIAHNLGISPQALTWQMNQLKKTGLIITEKTGINVRYCLIGADALKLFLKLTSG